MVGRKERKKVAQLGHEFGRDRSLSWLARRWNMYFDDAAAVGTTDDDDATKWLKEGNPTIYSKPARTHGLAQDPRASKTLPECQLN
jgi:hypothetical protein